MDANGNRTTYAYDNLNRLIQTQDSLGHYTTTVYDSNGNVAASVDANGNRTTYSYDSQNRQIQTQDALGHLTTTVYDSLGNVSATVDANGNRTTFSYDSQNRQIQTQDALGNLTTVVYDAAGQTLATVDANGQRTTYGYDANGRQVSTTDALNHTMTVVFDAAGNQVASIDALGKATTSTYDALNRVVAVQDPGGGIATTVYDANGNVVNNIDALGDKTTYVYDALNRQTQAIDAKGGITSYVYDNVGNRTVLIDPDGNHTTFVYDTANRLTQETDPLGNSTTYAYSNTGQMTSQTDQLGRRDAYVYDANGRLTQETWFNSSGTAVNTLVYSYDNAGNELTAGDSHGTYTMAYDALNRTSAVNGLFGTTLTFGYDKLSNRTSVQDNFGGVTTSVYDSANRLTSVQFSDGTTAVRFDLGYTLRNQVATLTRYSNLAGTTKIGESDSSYDATGRLQTLQAKNGSGTTLENFTYTYDLASRVTSQQLNGATTSYQYDATNQLTSDGLHSYGYDANGNRTMTGYTTGTGNQLTNDGTYTYTYDAAGNLIKKSEGASAQTWTYAYDNRNQMIGATERATDGGTLLVQGTYVYDVFNNRIEDDEWTSSAGLSVTRTVFDDRGNGWADLTSGNALQTRYLYEPGQVAPVARVSAGAVNWLVVDRLGSVVNVLDGSGNLLATVAYDGFGNIVTQTNLSATGKFTYTGLAYFPNEGSYGAKYRVYDPASGRWLWRDLTDFSAGDTNLYRYTGNDPTNGTDPSGDILFLKDSKNNPTFYGDCSTISAGRAEAQGLFPRVFPRFRGRTVLTALIVTWRPRIRCERRRIHGEEAQADPMGCTDDATVSFYDGIKKQLQLEREDGSGTVPYDNVFLPSVRVLVDFRDSAPVLLKNRRMTPNLKKWITLANDNRNLYELDVVNGKARQLSLNDFEARDKLFLRGFWRESLQITKKWTVSDLDDYFSGIVYSYTWRERPERLEALKAFGNIIALASSTNSDQVKDACCGYVDLVQRKISRYFYDNWLTVRRKYGVGSKELARADQLKTILDNRWFSVESEQWFNQIALFPESGHSALRITIKGTSSPVVFYFDDALVGGVGNEEHLWGPTDLPWYYKPTMRSEKWLENLIRFIGI